MDNNQFPNQPMQGQPMQGQPMNQGQPVNQPMQGQPMMQGYPGQQSYPGQPYPQQPQPMMKPPKQPMDPAKKKKIIIGASVGVGVAVVGILAAILVPMLLRVDYASAYKTAKELKPKLYDIYYSYDCEHVVDYVGSTYTSTKSYNEYVDSCLDLYNNGAETLVKNLGDTDGVKRNNEIKQQYEKFNAEFNALTAGGTGDLEAKMEIWQAWHNFVVAVADLSYGKSSDAEITSAANYLINSGNDAYKTYGEGWLSRTLEVAAAYRAYYNASWSASNYNELRDTYNNKKNEREDWLAANKPDIQTVAPLNFDDTSKMYSEFTKLYDLITATYEKNYNAGSGDCTEFLGEVYCE